MKVTLYKTTDQSNTINKTLTNPLEININLKRTEDQKSPRLLLKNDDNKYTGYNYAYIEFFKRYYFVESINNDNAKIIELHLETDVLETYKNDILNANGTIVKKVGTSYTNNSVNSDIRKDHTIYKSNVSPTRQQTNILITIGG